MWTFFIGGEVNESRGSSTRLDTKENETRSHTFFLHIFVLTMNRIGIQLYCYSKCSALCSPSSFLQGPRLLVSRYSSDPPRPTDKDIEFSHIDEQFRKIPKGDRNKATFHYAIGKSC